MSDVRCVACDDPLEGSEGFDFAGDRYCADCCTVGSCSNCGATGTVPRAALEGEAGVRCSNCGSTLSAGE
jgi:DNA-directed RNA polymerase subunit RPC12/RpoP